MAAQLFQLAPPLARAAEVVRRQGIAGAAADAGYHFGRYRRWTERREARSSAAAALPPTGKPGRRRPPISVVMPVYDVSPRWLVRAIESVRRQSDPRWQLCIADDASPGGKLRRILDAYRKGDSRIRVAFLEANRGISGASNAALELADGDFVALLDHDDELAPDALEQVARCLDEHPDTDMLYSDEDKLDRFGRRCDPYFKPAWSPDLLRSCMYTCHLGVYRRRVLNAVGGFRAGFEGVQDYDLALRVTERSDRIRRLPGVLYHWRKIPGSLARDTASKSYAFSRARRALREAGDRRGLAVTVDDGLWTGSFRVRYPVGKSPQVSVAMVARQADGALERSLERLAACRSTVSEIHLISAGGDSLQRRCARLAARHDRVRLRETPAGERTGQLWNRLALRAGAAVLLFLGSGCRPLDDESVSALLEHARRPAVGAAGARVTDDRDRLYHCGVVLGIGPQRLAGFPSRGFPSGDHGYFGRNAVVHNVSALAGGVLMVRRELFHRVGGFDPRLPGDLSSIDLCLKLRREGLRVVYTPFARYRRHRAEYRRTGGTVFAREPARRFAGRWRAVIAAGDPYYHPELTADRLDFSLRL